MLFAFITLGVMVFFCSEASASAVRGSYDTIDRNTCFYDPDYVNLTKGTRTIGAALEETLTTKGFTYRIVNCIQTMFLTFVDELGDVTKAFELYATAMVTIYILFFAYKVVLGNVKNVRGDFVKTIATASFVFYFSNAGVPVFLDFFIETQDAMVDTVSAGTIFREENRCSLQNMGGSVWRSIDCTIARVFGYDFVRNVSTEKAGEFIDQMELLPFDPRASSSNLLTAGVVGTAFTSFGVIGVVIFLMMVFHIIMGLVQAIATYIICFVALIFLAMIAPLVVPFFLFSYTKTMFDQWFVMVMGYTIVPAVLFAYLAFMVHILMFAVDGTGEGWGGKRLCDSLKPPPGYPSACDHPGAGGLLEGDWMSGSLFGVGKFLVLVDAVLNHKQVPSQPDTLEPDLFRGLIRIETTTEANNATEFANDPLSTNRGKDSESINVPSIRLSQGVGVVAYNGRLANAEVACGIYQPNATDVQDCINFVKSREATEERLIWRFMISLLAFAILAAITSSFTKNVIVFADRLSGVGSTFVQTPQMMSIGNTLGSRAKELAGLNRKG